MTANTKTLEEDIHALRNDMATLADTVGHLVSGAAAEATAAAQDGLSNGLNGAKHAGKEFLADAAKLKSDSVRAAEEVAGNASSLVADEIRRNPFVAVAAALCVGFVAGISRHR